MLKYIEGLVLVLLIGLIIGGFAMVNMSNKNSTKIPYNNGFYSGPYNPKLPVINPDK